MSETFRLRETDLARSKVADESVLLDLRSGNYLSINATGTALLEQLGAGATRSDLVGELQRAFELDAESADRDVSAFLDHLDEHGLLERSA